MNDYPLNGQASDAQDWQAAYDYALDQQRHPWPPRDLRSPCGNASCDQLCESVYCSELCRQEVEGSADHELDDEPQLGAAPALGEAPVSLNTFVTMAGRQVQVTLRGSDLQAVLQQMETLLQRYPVAPASVATQTPAGKDWCQVHSTSMKEQHGKDGSTWFSHKVGDGWCKGKGGSHG